MQELTLTLNPPLEQRFCVGRWIVDPARNLLQDDSDQTLARSLEPRLMLLLCFLAANPSRVLAREELSERLWPRVVVNENSLTRAVSELRRLLQQQQETTRTRYLETIPKRGYRLIESVSLLPEQHCVPSTVLTQSVQQTRFQRRPALRHVAMAACLALSVPLVSLLFENAVTMPVTMDPLFTDRVVDTEAAPLDAEFQLSALDISGPEQGAVAAELPVLSNDGQKLAFVRQENGLSRIYLASVEPIAAPAVVFSSTGRLTNLRWSPVGNALMFASEPASINRTLLTGQQPEPDLIMLDLDKLSIRVLIDNSGKAGDSSTGTKVNLT